MKVAIFDLDGLLIDSETSAWPKAIFDFLSNKGISRGIDDAEKKAKGAGHRETIIIFKEDLGLEGETEDLIVEMREYFYKTFTQNPVLTEGAKEIVKKLHEKKYILAIATGLGPRESVISLLESLGLKKYFKEIITGDEIAKGKPNAEIYLKMAKKLGVNPEECLVFEDSINGVKAGKNAKMKVFGVNKEEEIKRELKKAGADEVFSSLLEINNL
jgi:HAD superfamily hydrolase (TIGR01509 family)